MSKKITLHKAKYIFINGKIVEDASILVENGKIVEDADEYEIIDHGRALITPGFINFHTHLQYTDLNPYKGQGDFFDWILDLIKQYFFWSKSKKIKSLQNGLKETMKSGVTCVVNLGMEEDFIEVFNDADIKSYVFLEAYADTEKNSHKEFKRLMNSLEKYNTSNVGISPHAPYSVHPVLWKLFAESQALIHSHLYETADEIKWMNGQPSSIDKLRRFVMRKAFDSYHIDPFDNLIAAHLSQLKFEEVRKFQIAHCPRSNMILHGKTIDLYGDISNVGLGTDSKFSNYDLNILHEAKFLRDRSSLSFVEIMDILTINPARMLKLDNLIGSLESGKDADFLVFKLDKSQSYESILDMDQPNEIYVRGIKH